MQTAPMAGPSSSAVHESCAMIHQDRSFYSSQDAVGRLPALRSATSVSSALMGWWVLVWWLAGFEVIVDGLADRFGYAGAVVFGALGQGAFRVGVQAH